MHNRRAFGTASVRGATAERKHHRWQRGSDCQRIAGLDGRRDVC
jgi:hypothetical protein